MYKNVQGAWLYKQSRHIPHAWSPLHARYRSQAHKSTSQSLLERARDQLVAYTREQSWHKPNRIRVSWSQDVHCKASEALEQKWAHERYHNFLATENNPSKVYQVHWPCAESVAWGWSKERLYHGRITEMNEWIVLTTWSPVLEVALTTPYACISNNT